MRDVIQHEGGDEVVTVVITLQEEAACSDEVIRRFTHTEHTLIVVSQRAAQAMKKLF